MKHCSILTSFQTLSLKIANNSMFIISIEHLAWNDESLFQDSNFSSFLLQTLTFYDLGGNTKYDMTVSLGWTSDLIQDYQTWKGWSYPSFFLEVDFQKQISFCCMGY